VADAIRPRGVPPTVSGSAGVVKWLSDDALVMCRSKGQAVAALARLTVLLAELGLRPKPAKTRIVQLTVGGEGVDFLGFHHQDSRHRGRAAWFEQVPGRSRHPQTLGAQAALQVLCSLVREGPHGPNRSFAKSAGAFLSTLPHRTRRHRQP
jgi:hypothetical protein